MSLGSMERKLPLPNINLLDKHEDFTCVCYNVANDLLFFLAQHTLFRITSLQCRIGELSHTHFLLPWYCQ